MTYDDAVHPEFDPQAESYQVYHDANSSWDVSTTLILSLSSLTGDGSTQMPPLHRAIDPDELQLHVRGRTNGAHVTFEFHGHEVTVHDDGLIEFTPLDEQEA